MTKAESKIKEVKKRIEHLLLDIPGVIGVGIGEKMEKRSLTPCIRVYVERLDEELIKRIPREFEGVPTEVKEVGKINLL